MRDRVGSLHELLQSLARCTRPPHEAIVIDDAPADRLDVGALQAMVPFCLRVLRNETFIGPVVPATVACTPAAAALSMRIVRRDYHLELPCTSAEPIVSERPA